MKNLLNSCVFVLCVLSTFAALAEIPNGYYNRAEGAKREVLKTSLSKIIQPTKVLKYGGRGEGYTWEGFYYTDRLSNDMVLDRYSSNERSFTGFKSIEGMHIEHSFANSWWGGINNDAYKDLHHLYPADGSANISKSNHPIGVVTETGGFDNGMIKVGLSNCFRADTLIKVWEPSDTYKGDFARTYMYMATCYESYYNLWTSEGLLMLENDTYPVIKPWAMDLLLKWNHDDPVSDVEKARNEEVYKIQGNRNPFIDYPQLAEYIWGDKTNSAFYTVSATSPVLFLPMNGSAVDFGLLATNHPDTCTIDVRGLNLSNNLNVSISGTTFTINKSSFTPQEVADGAVLTIIGNSTVVGNHTEVLTLTSEGISTSVNVSATYMNGIPAFAATNISVSSKSSSFTANWKTLPGKETVSLDVYTKSSDGTPTSVAGYPTTVTGNSSKVTVPENNTTYYYKVSSNGAESNEISVVVPAIPPVFTTSRSSLSFYTKPNQPSQVQELGVTLLYVSNLKIECATEAPFQISSDGGETWGETAMLNGSSNLLVRMGAYPTEASCEAELVLTNPDATDIVVNLSSEVSRANAFYENFESGSKSSYASADVICTASKWNMNNALLGSTASDQKNDSRSLRLKSTGVATMLQDKEDGVGTLSFFAGVYGSDTGMSLKVEYSTDNGSNWANVIESLPLNKGEWKEYTYTLNVENPVRLRFTAIGATNKRVNLDDVRMTDYNTSSVAGVNASNAIITLVGDNLNVETDKESTLTICDALGRTLQVSQVKEGLNVIPLHLSQGCYFANLDNAKVYKFVVVK